MELIPGSETSTHLIQTPGIYPENNTLHISGFFSKPSLKESSDKKVILNICSEVNHSKSFGGTLNHLRAKINNYRLYSW
jgi:hypothetical protein